MSAVSSSDPTTVITNVAIDFLGGTFHVIYPIGENICGAMLEYEIDDGDDDDGDDDEWEDVSDDIDISKSGAVLV